MTKVFLSLKQALNIGRLMAGFLSFILISGIFISIQQPSYATTLEELKLIPPEYKPNAEEKINRAYEYDPGVGLQEEDRQKAYEEAVKDSKNLNTLEKAYKKNLKDEPAQKTQSSFGEKASKLIEKATGK